MAEDHLRKLEEIYSAALQRDTSQGAEFVRHACAGDENLLREFEWLLSYDEKPGGFREAPALEAVDPLFTSMQSAISNAANSAGSLMPWISASNMRRRLLPRMSLTIEESLISACDWRLLSRTQVAMRESLVRLRNQIEVLPEQCSGDGT